MSEPRRVPSYAGPSRPAESAPESWTQDVKTVAGPVASSPAQPTQAAPAVHVHVAPPSPAPDPVPAPRKKSGWGGVVAGVIVLVVALALVASFRSATLQIGVVNTHFLYTVSVRIAVDGVTVHEDSYAPGQMPSFDYRVMWLGGNCASKLVTADATGGGLGPTHDSRAVSVCNGDTAPVLLAV